VLEFVCIKQSLNECHYVSTGILCNVSIAYLGLRIVRTAIGYTVSFVVGSKDYSLEVFAGFFYPIWGYAGKNYTPADACHSLLCTPVSKLWRRS